MKKITNLFACTFLAITGFAQSGAAELLKYRPAPGQHINIENIGTPQAAQRMTENFSSLVSLGSFGGMVVLQFKEACINHPDNPYGIDFTVFGNSFAGSSEPGVVWVMQDENLNGLPDDTWYEIAGSQHFYSKTIRNYEVTYIKTDSRDVFWKDNFGNTGWIPANSYNLQEYYPNKQNFPQYPQDSVTFCGTLLKSEIDFSNTQEIKVIPPVFGYADSHLRIQGVDLFVPDNPYTKELEGAGGDPIDISWAVDSLGNYVDLDSIHFVKIVSGSLLSAGWLGEISTDVAWVEPVHPNSGVTGKEDLLVVFPPPSKLIVGDSILIETAYFEKGRKAEKNLSFFSQNEQIIKSENSGWLKAEAVGETEIQIAAEGEVERVKIKVVRPDSLRILNNFSSVYPGDTVKLSAQVYDNEKEKLSFPVKFAVSNPLVGAIESVDGEFHFIALNAGETILTAFTEGFDLKQQVTVKVFSPEDKIRIYFSAKTEDENLLPWQWIEVGADALNHFVESRQKDYSGLEKPTLFHVLAAGLQKAGVSFAFKDDDASNGKLYLHAVEADGLFYYGWGGKTEPAAYARSWVARLNNEHFLNGFDQTVVSTGDTVALYHVSKVTEPWNYLRMLASADSAVAGDEIEVRLTQSECKFSDGEILQSDFSPVTGAEIVAGSSFYTNASGKAVFTLETNPPLVVSAGNEAVLISLKLSLGTSQTATRSFRVYPNPVVQELIVEGLTDFSLSKPFVRLISAGGVVVLEQEIADRFQRFDLRHISPGIYSLVVNQGKSSETHKIIKK